jgi:hypothetical protein
MPIRWLGSRRIDFPDAAAWPVRVRKDAFGPAAPARDLLLSPDHAIFVHGALVPARYLLNGGTVVAERVATVEYWHLELPAHGIVFAENLAAESYLDTGNRAAFAGGAASRVAA